VDIIFFRKIITASLSGSIYAILLGLIVPNPFGESIPSLADYLFAVAMSTPVYLMYSFPVIFVYGIFASIISDKVTQLVMKRANSQKIEIVLSAVLHLLFGLVLQLYSLAASILFFIVDRVLQKGGKNYTGMQALKSLAVPLAVWIFFMGIIWLEHLL
jgi:hypothetical protein